MHYNEQQYTKLFMLLWSIKNSIESKETDYKLFK